MTGFWRNDSVTFDRSQLGWLTTNMRQMYFSFIIIHKARLKKFRMYNYTSKKSGAPVLSQNRKKNVFVSNFFFTFSALKSVDAFFSKTSDIFMITNKRKTDGFIRPKFLKNTPPILFLDPPLIWRCTIKTREIFEWGTPFYHTDKYSLKIVRTFNSTIIISKERRLLYF